MNSAHEDFDAVVVGGGFGGLGAALALAEGGARVALCETLAYLGGCAATFRRRGVRFEAGATIVAGLGEEHLFGRWIARHRLALEIEELDPVLEFRDGHHQLVVPRDPGGLLQSFVALPGAPRAKLEAFFALQRRISQTLWPVLENPELLPPFSWRSIFAHLERSPAYLGLLRWMGRPLFHALAHHGLERFEPLTRFADALCQITLQCSARTGEALFALAAFDYYHRGTGHVRGGIGRLAEGLGVAIERAGGSVRTTERVRGIEKDGGRFLVDTRHGVLRARHVVLNLLPQDARRLLGSTAGKAKPWKRLHQRVESGWGACMLYRLVEGTTSIPSGARHVEVVADASLPFVEGNHVFVSASPQEEGPSSLTASTHMNLRSLRELDEPSRSEHVARIQDRMRATLRARLPEWEGAVVAELTASPRTFERFTSRSGGWVGGAPRLAGRRAYADLWPVRLPTGVHLVGDSVFPGQSVLSTATGGTRVAARILRHHARTTS